jgi:hypothetical protein
VAAYKARVEIEATAVQESDEPIRAMIDGTT